MGIVSVMLGKAKKLTICDWIMLKLNLIIVGMVIGAYLTNFVKANLLVIVIVWIILEGVLMHRFFGRK